MDDILFLAHRIPYPPDRGDKIRSWAMLKYLAGRGRVHLACLADDITEAAHLPALRDALGESLGAAEVAIRKQGRAAAGVRALVRRQPVSLPAFDSPALGRYIEQILRGGRVGTIFCFSSQMAQYIPAGWQGRFVMDFVDMDSAKFAGYAARARGPMAWLYRREADRLLAHERATARRAHTNLFATEAEAALFRGRAGLPETDIRAVQNGVDLAFYDPDANFPRRQREDGALIAFTGQMDYLPNAEAAAAFAREVLPRIRAVRPDTRFAIVGRNPGKALRRLGQGDGVIVTGVVEDIRTWLAAADLVVAPLRLARGVQNKVLEAMAMGRPVIASPAAFEGIEAQLGRDLLVADGAVAEADAALALLADPDRAEAMGRAARRQMERAYRWEARLAPLAGILSAPRWRWVAA